MRSRSCPFDGKTVEKLTKLDGFKAQLFIVSEEMNKKHLL